MRVLFRLLGACLGVLFIVFGVYELSMFSGNWWRVLGDVGNMVLGLIFIRYSVKGYVFKYQ